MISTTILASTILVGVKLLVGMAAASVDHDGWEFYGGQKKRLKHGLNRATADAAVRNYGNVRFDNPGPETKPDLLITNDEAPPPRSTNPALRISSDRIKSKQELLLLPDRYSVLDFAAKHHGEETPWWGRLYINGFPNAIQYFRAEFGYPPPNKAVKLALASPLNMCNAETGLPLLDNADKMDESTVVVTVRGGCTFGDKAMVAHEVGLIGILFVNNEEGLFHPAGPEVRDIEMSSFMITQHDGAHLINALQKVSQTTVPQYSLNGRFVPVVCENNPNDSSYCNPLFFDDLRFEKDMNYTGKLYTSSDGDADHVFDYVQGEFGSWLDPLAEWNTMVPSVIGGDAHCCDRAGFKGSEVSNETALLCLRGECDFLTKAENAAATGAGMLIVSSCNNTLTRMGADPPYRGRKVNATTIMVTSDAYEEMVSNFYSQLDNGKTSSVRMNQPVEACESVN